MSLSGTRNISWSALAEPISWCEASLRTIHGLPILEGGVPYWMAIVGLTVLLRTCVTLPIALRQRSKREQHKALAPIIQSWEKTFRHQITLEGGSQAATYERFQGRLSKLVRTGATLAVLSKLIVLRGRPSPFR
jgi:membrane protein insertase Oxa1/YidC/SpoIIIJ